MLKKPLIYPTIVIAILVGGIFAYLAYQLSEEAGSKLKLSASVGGERVHLVELREDGFYPTETVIAVGDTVRFTTTRETDFWPASDPHPSHTYDSSFDSTREIHLNENWTYAFNKVGEWNYHDHISVSSRGTIMVVKRSSSETGAPLLDSGCQGYCFDSIIRTAVHEEGIEAAYDLFTEAFRNRTLPPSCHWTAHQIGEAAYEIFREGTDFPITKVTEYCGFGFYHGFMESLLRENPDVEIALSFCTRVEKQLGKNALENCYHGIGHGFTEDPPDPLVYGDFEAVVRPGIEICEFIFGDNFGNLNLCLTGVFTVPAGFAEKSLYGFTLDTDDPFSLCRAQPYRYQKACYGEIAPKLVPLLDWDISNLPRYLENITDPNIVQLVTWVVPAVMVAKHITDEDHDQYIQGCRENFLDILHKICIGGTILGFFSHGEPDRQYITAFRFCGSEEFLKDAQQSCFEEALQQAQQLYAPELMDEVCSAVPSTYKQLCLSDILKSVYEDHSFDGDPVYNPSFVKTFVVSYDR